MKKFRLKIALICLLVSVISCQQVAHTEEPENLIPEDKMVNVLTDLLKLDAAESYSSIEFKNRDVSTKDLIFKKYQIDSLQFVESSNYYAEDFKINERIYDRVRIQLEQEKNLYDSLVKQEKDSLQKSKKNMNTSTLLKKAK